MNRHEARESAFVIIFEFIFQGKFGVNVQDLLAAFLDIHQAKSQENYIKDVVLGCVAQNETINNKIKKNLKEGWRIERLNTVTLALLRLGLYEIYFHQDIPHTVTNNEITNLANKYEGIDAAIFINGFLGNIQKELTNAIV